MTRIAFPFLFFLLLTASIAPAAKDLRTKEERLYAIKLRTAQWEVSSKQLQMENRKSDLDAIQDLYEDKIETLSSLNKAKRAYQQANFDYQQAIFDLKRTRLDFLRDATHLTIRKAVKYRTRDGRRQIDITIHVGARSNVAGNTILIGILVLLVVGIGLASIKISRR